MGLAFWRAYHEQQQEKAAESKKPVKEASPLKALQLQQDPTKIKKPTREREVAKEAPVAPAPASASHSRSSKPEGAQED